MQRPIKDNHNKVKILTRLNSVRLLHIMTVEHDVVNFKIPGPEAKKNFLKLDNFTSINFIPKC